MLTKHVRAMSNRAHAHRDLSPVYLPRIAWTRGYSGRSKMPERCGCHWKTRHIRWFLPRIVGTSAGSGTGLLAVRRLVEGGWCARSSRAGQTPPQDAPRAAGVCPRISAPSLTTPKITDVTLSKEAPLMLLGNGKHGDETSVVVIQRHLPFAYCQISIHHVMIVAEHVAELVRYCR